MMLLFHPKLYVQSGTNWISAEKYLDCKLHLSVPFKNCALQVLQKTIAFGHTAALLKSSSIGKLLFFLWISVEQFAPASSVPALRAHLSCGWGYHSFQSCQSPGFPQDPALCLATDLGLWCSEWNGSGFVKSCFPTDFVSQANKDQLFAPFWIQALRRQKEASMRMSDFFFLFFFSTKHAFELWDSFPQYFGALWVEWLSYLQRPEKQISMARFHFGMACGSCMFSWMELARCIKEYHTASC